MRPILHTALALGLLAGPAHAQDTLVRAALDLSLQPPGDGAVVVLRYVVRSATGAASLPVSAIPFETDITAVEARVDDVPAVLELSPDAAGLLRGEVRLPPSAAGAVERVVEIRYAVQRAWAGGTSRVRIPILTPAWPPAAALPGTVRGTIALPAGTAAHDAFPATLRSAPGSAAGEFALQVVPSFVAFSVTDGAKPLFTLATTVEGVALALLLLIGLLGWRQFQKEQ